MYHKTTIVGNLGRDPEMRYLPSGQAVTNMNVACNRVYKNANGEKITETIWFRISAWGKLAENCNLYLKKGRTIFAEIRLTPDLETGGPRVFSRNDGTTGASYEAIALDVRFIGGQGETRPLPGQDEFGGDPGYLDPDDVDDIPF